MPHRCQYVDVFTDRPLTGNQLAVFDDATEIPEHLYQPLAQEIGFSETTFVLPGDRVRIFTPHTELPFAGHPVLGTARVLTRRRGSDAVTLQTGRGPVPVTFDATGRGTMTQPVPVASPWPCPEEELWRALGLRPHDRHPAGIAPQVYDNGPRHVIVVAASPSAVDGLQPDLGALAALSPGAGVGVVAALAEPTTFLVRYFFPGGGISEDPATGSLAGPLAVHLVAQGLAIAGTALTVRQGEQMGRPSVLYPTAHSDGRVTVAGDVVFVGEAFFSWD